MRRITNVCLPQPRSRDPKNQFWTVLLDAKGHVLSINPMSEGVDMESDNWQGDLLSPMALDLQVNGGLGLSFSQLAFKDLPKLHLLLERLWSDGVEAICPTFVSTSLPQIRLGLEVLREARKNHSHESCELLGAHLEGPFLAREKHGAHAINHLKPPTLSNLREIIQGFEDDIALFTLAPELDGASDVIQMLNSFEIAVCLGHSSASAEESKVAFNKGVRMLTHTFNAMPGLMHRDPGPIGEAIKNGQIAMGLIADGIHVHPDIVRILQKLASDQIVLVSDVISPYGLLEGNHNWDSRDVIAKNGVCRLANGMLAGSTLPLLEGCKRMASWSSDPSSAVWSATVAPRSFLKKDFQMHQFFQGKPLNKLLRWKLNPDSKELSWQMAA